MKIIHVVAGLEPDNGAGVTAQALAREEARLGHEVTLVSTVAAHNTAHVQSEYPIRLFSRTPLVPACFSWQMLRGFAEVLVGADWLHIHCDWTFPVWWAAYSAVRAGVPYVMRPAGSFDPVRLGFSAAKKRLAAPVERWCLRHAAAVHATCAAEEEWVRAYEPRVRRVFTVHNGTDLGEVVWNTSQKRRLLYLGRNHPLKGLDILEEALRGVEGCELRMEHAAFGAEKESAFAWCDALVLPTRSENFGLVVAEALARGKPVIVTDGAPWRSVREHSCGWYVEGFGMAQNWDRAAAVENLRRALVEFANTPIDGLVEMGRRGREWMAAEYSWHGVTLQLLDNFGK